MLIMKGIVKSVSKGSAWKASHGDYHNYNLTINYEGIDYNGSTLVKDGYDCKFIIGQECSFTTKEPLSKSEPNKFKWDYESFKQSPASSTSTSYTPTPQKSGNSQAASFALSYAKDLVCSHGVSNNIDNNPKVIAEQTTAIAEILFDWLNSK